MIKSFKNKTNVFVARSKKKYYKQFLLLSSKKTLCPKAFLKPRHLFLNSHAFQRTFPYKHFFKTSDLSIVKSWLIISIQLAHHVYFKCLCGQKFTDQAQFLKINFTRIFVYFCISWTFFSIIKNTQLITVLVSFWFPCKTTPHLIFSKNTQSRRSSHTQTMDSSKIGVQWFACEWHSNFREALSGLKSFRCINKQTDDEPCLGGKYLRQITWNWLNWLELGKHRFLFEDSGKFGLFKSVIQRVLMGECLFKKC